MSERGQEKNKTSSVKCRFFDVRSIILTALLIIQTVILVLVCINGISSENTATETTSITACYHKNINDNFKNCNPKEVNVTQTKTQYNLPTIFFLTTSAVTLFVLIVFLVKDDSGVRYAKLDELHSIKEKLLADGFPDSFGENTETESSDRNKTTKSKTSNRTALLMHYMDCVTEI